MNTWLNIYIYKRNINDDRFISTIAAPSSKETMEKCVVRFQRGQYVPSVESDDK